MSENMRISSTQHPPRRGRRWLRALLIGLGLFIATTIVMLLTGNLNLYPTVILIGNFLVPVVFVAFLYDHQHISSLSLDTVATSFPRATRCIEPHSGSVPGWGDGCWTD
jgi:Flp pilus assembly protein TadB